jgi:hypothetical protein
VPLFVALPSSLPVGKDTYQHGLLFKGCKSRGPGTWAFKTLILRTLVQNWAGF